MLGLAVGWVSIFDTASRSNRSEQTKMRTGDTDGGSTKSNRKPRRVGESYDAEFLGYINVPLDKEQKSRFDAWFRSSSFTEQLEAFVADGINISIKLDVRSGGFLASATQRRVGSPNAGYVVTARASEAVTALGRVVYCLTILSKAEKWTDVQPPADPDRW